MKSLTAKVTRAIGRGAWLHVCDNSGAKIAYLVSVKGAKTSRGRYPAAGVGDLINVAIKKGTPDTKKKLFPAIIVRQKKEYRRPEGTRIKFEDNAVIICKDDKGNPKGTIIKGPVAKEVTERWPPVGKVASIVV